MNHITYNIRSSLCSLGAIMLSALFRESITQLFRWRLIESRNPGKQTNVSATLDEILGGAYASFLTKRRQKLSHSHHCRGDGSFYRILCRMKKWKIHFFHNHTMRGLPHEI